MLGIRVDIREINLDFVLCEKKVCVVCGVWCVVCVFLGEFAVGCVKS